MRTYCIMQQTRLSALCGLNGKEVQKERLYVYMGFSGGSAVKNPPANAGDIGLIPGSGDPLEKERTTHSSILAWELPWTEEPGRLQSTGPQRVRPD